VAWLRGQDRAGRLRTMPYQEAPSPPMTPAIYTACSRAVHVIKPDGEVLRAGRGSLLALETAGWGWKARLLSWPPLLWIVELGYYLIARNRRLVSRFLFRAE
jgi:predicted DCC family thiol-disulfide oxidoreductase YuxK